jgi:hypothetical protein
MSLDVAAADAAAEAPPAPVAARGQILAYIGILALLLGFASPSGGLIAIPVSFMLKNKLHLASHDVANFRLVAAIPLFLGFMFGFARDRWNLFGRKDRGLLMLFGAAGALTFVYFAFAPATYWSLMGAVLLGTAAYLFAQAAKVGLASQIGQQLNLSGQVATVWYVLLLIPGLAAYFVGGHLSQSLEGRGADSAARTLFLVAAGFMAVVALVGLWRPKAVYDNLHVETAPSKAMDDVRRILRHWPVYPALGCWFLFSFSPGSDTPLQYYLQNTLHASDADWGTWNAIFAGSFIPTTLLFGALCRKFSLRTLLIWGTVVAVPQMVPLALIHTVAGSFWAAAFIGLTGGVASAAYIAFLIRSCPPGLQGTTQMMATALYWVAIRFGDVLGTQLYEKAGGFTTCVVAITVVYALILPVIFLAPRALIDTPDA